MTNPKIGDKVWLLAEIVSLEDNEFPTKDVMNVLIYNQDVQYRMNTDAINSYERYVLDSGDRVSFKDDTGDIVIGKFIFADGQTAWVRGDRGGNHLVELKKVSRM